MPEMKERPGQGASSTSTVQGRHQGSCGITPALNGVKFRFAARSCSCACDVCVIDAELTVHCVDCGVKRGHLTERTAGFLERVTAQFGPPIEPVILRREVAR
jgi:hypothetical protein